MNSKMLALLGIILFAIFLAGCTSKGNAEIKDMKIGNKSIEEKENAEIENIENEMAKEEGRGSEKSALKAGKLPSFEDVSLYSSASPFNKKIIEKFGSNPEIDPNSQLMIDLLAHDSGNFVIMLKQYSSTVYFADENTPRHNVTLYCGPGWELGVDAMKDVPIPDLAEPTYDADGANNPALPDECGEDADQDNFMVVLDLSSRCEYDLWQARKTNGRWGASWSNRIDMDSDGIFNNGLSARGSGFAFMGGVIWPDELKAGKIEHVLSFSYPHPKSGGPVPPATESDGISNEPGAIPEGALLQLNPDLDLDSLNLRPYEKTIAKALQEYGMMLVDRGGSTGIGLYAINPKSAEGNPYEGILPDEDYVDLSNIPLDEFRVLKLEDQISDWSEKAELIKEDRCGRIE